MINICVVANNGLAVLIMKNNYLISERSSPILITNHTEEQPGSYTLYEETILMDRLLI